MNPDCNQLNPLQRGGANQTIRLVKSLHPSHVLVDERGLDEGVSLAIEGKGEARGEQQAKVGPKVQASACFQNGAGQRDFYRIIGDLVACLGKHIDKGFGVVVPDVEGAGNIAAHRAKVPLASV